MAITIRDLARMSDVSIATVSRVLSGKDNVSEEKRQNILDLADRLGYRPSRLASNLSRQRSGIIGLVASNMENPSYIHFINEMDVFCREHQYNSVVTVSHLNSEQEVENLNTMIEHRAEGLLIFPVSDLTKHPIPQNVLAMLKQSGIPTVFIAPMAGSGFDSVTAEEYDSARELTRQFLQRGHKRFAVMGDDPKNRPARVRLQGICDELEAAGLDPASIDLRLNTIDSIPRLGPDVLKRGTDRPTTLISLSTNMLLHLLPVLEKHRIKVPRDLSCAGFDDLEWCSLMSPQITVMHSNIREIARQAFETLLARRDKSRMRPRNLELPRQLMLRESIAEPKS